MLEFFRHLECPLGSCKFCAIPSRTSIKCCGVAPHPTKLSNDSYSNSSELLPIGSDQTETDYPSMNNSKRKKNYFGNKVRINNNTLLGIFK